MAATRAKKLRTGRSFWLSLKAPHIAFVKAHRNIDVDVLVIGAGISGALISDMLSASKVKVAVVDRRGPLLGSTPASTALLQYEIDTPLAELGRKIGVNHAMRAWRRSRLGLEGLAHRTRYLGIECDAFRRNSFSCSLRLR